METKPYQLICGSSNDVAKFEEKIAAAIEQGYELVDDLITQVVTKADGQVDVMFYQPMLFDTVDEYDIEDDEAFEEEEEFLVS